MKRKVVNRYNCGGCGKEITSDGMSMSELVYWPPSNPKPLCVKCAPKPGPSLKELRAKTEQALGVLKKLIGEI